ncbi:MAG: imidazoleglycerol-phosphate dehydratase HisB [Clostridia bacterium]|nr:imidazoleglycerol-phosphate dehydratase HisB [Clostridia bacterium]
MRRAEISRKTNETDIKLTLNLDGTGIAKINTGCGFLDHMLELFARHSGYDLEVDCVGDTRVDYHHTTEDIGIVLGQAFASALADKKGIYRYGDIILPMDEALILCAVDISGRGESYYGLQIPSYRVGNFDTELVEEFLRAFARDAGVTVHTKQLAGSNSHHIIEGTFKALARALAKASAINEKARDTVPSTKGVL